MKKLSEATKNKISISMKGGNSGSFKKGCVPWIKGRKLSKSHRDKIASAHLGKKRSTKQKINMSKGMKGMNSREKNVNWNGGKAIINGYLYILNPDHPNCTCKGYVSEHRLVMEKHLGRYLTKKEVVHHEDKNTLNNDISNLRLFSSDREHRKYHSENYNNF